MNVFVMWSGGVGRRVARELRYFLETVVPGPKYFMSSEDIEIGAVWDQILAGAVSTANIGIACLTRASLSSTWLHFEAGAISKSSEPSSVIPYLVGVAQDEVDGPLSRFQMTESSRDGTASMAKMLRRALGPDRASSEEAFRRAFESQWPSLESVIGEQVEAEDPDVDKEEKALDELMKEFAKLRRSLAGQTATTRPTSLSAPGEIEIANKLLNEIGDGADSSRLQRNIERFEKARLGRDPDERKMAFYSLLVAINTLRAKYQVGTD